MQTNDTVHLNVGGQRFSTSKRTLLSVQGEETFFTSLLSGRISSNEDENGAIFIDRDPTLFRLILNYLRTHQLHLLVEESNPNQISGMYSFHGKLYCRPSKLYLIIKDQGVSSEGVCIRSSSY